MRNQIIRRHIGNLNPYCLVKGVSLQRLHALWFQLWPSRKGKTVETVKKKKKWLSGPGGKEWIDRTRGCLEQ